MRSILGAVLIVASLSALAQTKTFVGLKVGGGASTAYMQHSLIPTVFDVSWIPGTTAGIQVTHFSHKYKSRVNSAIQFSVNYVQKGWLQKFEDTDEPNHTTRINYIEVPIEAVGYFGNKNKYYISAGFFVEYAVSDNVDPTPESATVNEEYPVLFDVGQSNFYRYDISKDQRLNYGPRAAGGIFRETSAGVFRLEAFFTFSIRSVFDFEPVESGVPDLSLNYGAGVTLSYMFSLGKLDLNQ